MKSVLLLGRCLYGAIFIMSGVTHLSSTTQGYAAMYGVPPWLTIAAGLLACAGGLSVALGFRARAGAWMIAAFLVPVTLVMHRFWGLADPEQAAMQMANFMKNVSMLGAALIIAYIGSGPYSLDSERPVDRVEKRAERRSRTAVLRSWALLAAALAASSLGFSQSTDPNTGLTPSVPATPAQPAPGITPPSGAITPPSQGIVPPSSAIVPPANVIVPPPAEGILSRDQAIATTPLFMGTTTQQGPLPQDQQLQQSLPQQQGNVTPQPLGSPLTP